SNTQGNRRLLRKAQAVSPVTAGTRTRRRAANDPGRSRDQDEVMAHDDAGSGPRRRLPNDDVSDATAGDHRRPQRRTRQLPERKNMDQLRTSPATYDLRPPT